MKIYDAKTDKYYFDELLTKRHLKYCAKFDCLPYSERREIIIKHCNGMRDYLLEEAMKGIDELRQKTYIIMDDKKIVAFYTLSAITLPFYKNGIVDEFPAVKFTNLAVNRKYGGRGIGRKITIGVAKEAIDHKPAARFVYGDAYLERASYYLSIKPLKAAVMHTGLRKNIERVIESDLANKISTKEIETVDNILDHLDSKVKIPRF